MSWRVKMFNWYDDANVQIIGLNTEDMSLKEKMEASKIVRSFNESMRYKNVIKRQEEEIKKLKGEADEKFSYIKR